MLFSLNKCIEQVMTITNYNGVARDYVRRLIHALGATYTPNLTQENTHVISSR